MTADARPATLAALDSVCRTASELQAVLTTERDALATADIEAIEETARAKATAAGNLARARAELYRLSGTTDPDAMNAWLDRLTHEDDALSERRAHARDALARCDHANDVNGRILLSARRQTESALDLLLGHRDGDDAGVYDANGDRRPGSRGRALETV